MKYTVSKCEHCEHCRETAQPAPHISQHQHHVKPLGSPLYVVTVVTNPYRYYTRYRLYRAFEKHVLDSGGIPVTIEIAQRNRHFEVTSSDNPYHIQLRSPETANFWMKEMAINLVMNRIPDMEYLAWVDADVTFTRPDWVQETLHVLQIHKVCQMWTHAIDLGPQNEIIAKYTSFMHTYLREHHLLGKIDRKKPAKGFIRKTADGRKIVCDAEGGDYYGGSGSEGKLHTGYAWAARRSALADLGGLIDFAILGSADRHMAYGLIGQIERSYPPNVHSSYKRQLKRWQERALEYINYDIGVMEGTIVHHFHGSKKFRRYEDRWAILTKHQFDPVEDLIRDPQGIFRLTEKKWKLRDDIRNYLSMRNEDSIDL